jgi:formylglycine-generating enzyme
MTLVEIQKRFENAFDNEKENQNWEKLKTLLLSEDKESVVQGMNLIENLDEQVYYDGICTFLEDGGNGNWKLKDGLGCGNDLALKVEILRMAEENLGHEIKEAFENGSLEEMFVSVCGEIEVEELSESQKERLLSKVSEMVEVKGQEGRFSVMKYQVTQVFWESLTGSNPSHFRGASRPVEQVSWFDCVIFANMFSEKLGLEKVYEIPEGMEEACRNQTDSYDTSIDKYAQHVKVNTSANGYRLPTAVEWEYGVKGGENYTYAGSNDLNEVGWYTDNSGRKTHGVGQKKSNGYGLYDISGNVWEWCFDADLPSIRLRRGGGWSNKVQYCEVSYRGRSYPSRRCIDYGVRFFSDLFSKNPDPPFVCDVIRVSTSVVDIFRVSSSIDISKMSK